MVENDTAYFTDQEAQIILQRKSEARVCGWGWIVDIGFTERERGQR